MLWRTLSECCRKTGIIVTVGNFSFRITQGNIATQ